MYCIPSFACFAAGFLWKIEHWEGLRSKSCGLLEEIHFALTTESALKKVRDQGTQSFYSDCIDACDSGSRRRDTHSCNRKNLILKALARIELAKSDIFLELSLNKSFTTPASKNILHKDYRITILSLAFHDASCYSEASTIRHDRKFESPYNWNIIPFIRDSRLRIEKTTLV